MTSYPNNLTTYATFCALIALSPTVSAQQAPHQAVTPEVPTQVVLSNRDTNRIVCMDGQIDGYRFSEEKGASVDASGIEAFIKFQIEQLGDTQKHVSIRSEFYFQCGGVTYTLLALPRDVPAKTVHLIPGVLKQAQVNQRQLAPLADEARAIAITERILKNELPASYVNRLISDPYNRAVLPKLDLRLAREVEVPGTAYSAREYHLRARTKAHLSEKAFLRPEFGAAIYAVTLDRLSLEAGEVARAVLIYRGDGS